MTKKAFWGLIFVGLVLGLIFSCSSIGTRSLTKERIDSIIIGKTTKKEVVQMLGYPLPADVAAGYPVHKFNEVGLQNYLYQNTMRKQDEIPKGQYEVWQYWYLFQAAALPFAPQIRHKRAIVVFDNREVVFKIYFSDIHKLTPFGPKSLPEPEFEEIKPITEEKEVKVPSKTNLDAKLPQTEFEEVKPIMEENGVKVSSETKPQTPPSRRSRPTSEPITSPKAKEYWSWGLGVLVKTEQKTVITRFSDVDYSSARTHLKIGDEIVRIGKETISPENALKVLTKPMPKEADGLVPILVRRDGQDLAIRFKPNEF